MQSQPNAQAVPTDIIPATIITRQCAWCLAEAGLPFGEGSHGICAEHADNEYQKWQEKRKARKEINE